MLSNSRNLSLPYLCGSDSSYLSSLYSSWIGPPLLIVRRIQSLMSQSCVAVHEVHDAIARLALPDISKMEGDVTDVKNVLSFQL